MVSKICSHPEEIDDCHLQKRNEFTNNYDYQTFDQKVTNSKVGVYMQQYIENNDIENKLAVEIRDESLKNRNTPMKVNSMVASMSVPNDPFGRLYAKSRVMQEEGKKRRKDIAKKVAPKNIVFKTISAKNASALYNRLFLNADHRKTTLIQDSQEKFHEKKTSGLEITKERKTALFTRLYEDASLRLHKSKETAFIKTIKQGQGVMSITEARKTALFTRLYEDASLRLRKAEEAAMIKATSLFARLLLEERLRRKGVLTEARQTALFNRLHENNATTT